MPSGFRLDGAEGIGGAAAKDKISAYLNQNSIELQVYDQYYEMLGSVLIWDVRPGLAPS